MSSILRLVNEISVEKNNITLYPNALTILFEHHRYIKNIFLGLNGLYELSHVGMTIIDPAQQSLSFSATPNIEYNLIYQRLWQQDSCFSFLLNSDNGISWWDSNKEIEHHEQIKKIKLKNNQFTQGLSISKKVGDFHFIYSYATKSIRDDLCDYYHSHIFRLFDIGDYFYRAVRDIYALYSTKYRPPQLNHMISHASEIVIKPCLKLVTNHETTSRR